MKIMEIEVAKIVGAINDKSWSQVHSFKPEGEKLKTHGQLVAALAFKAKRELKASSFGTEIITRLQETYYSNQSQSILKKLSQTMESLAAEFLEAVELEIVMAVVWAPFAKAAEGQGGEKFVYVGKSGGGQAYLARGNKLVGLLEEGTEELGVVSGKLEPGDRLLLGTDQFHGIVAEGVIGPALDQDKASQAVENLAPLVHGHEENSRAAAAVIKVQGLEVLSDEDTKTGEEIKPAEKEEGRVTEQGQWIVLAGRVGEKMKERARLMLSRIRRWLKRGGGEVYVRPERGKQRRSAATVVVVLVLVFGVSLILAARKRRTSKQQQAYQQLIEEVEYRYKEGQSLIELNPLRAKSLLKEAMEAISQYGEESKQVKSEELEEWEKQIGEALNQVQREYQVDEASEWFDFGLVKEGFVGSDWDGEEEEMVVWDEDGAVMIKVSLRTKAAEVIKTGDEIRGGRWVGLTGKRVFVVGNGVIKTVETEEGELVAEQVGEWGRVKDVVGFSSNLYVLDGVSDGQIWKYMGVESGLSSGRAYLQGDTFDLSEAVDMAIDGSVWVLFTDGTVVKYTRGVKDAFVIAGLDQEFGEPMKLYTSSEVESLYVVDKQKTRVVVIAKSGEYQAQYVWPGIAGVKDLIVSEELGKIFLLTGEKVFAVELRD